MDNYIQNTNMSTSNTMITTDEFEPFISMDEFLEEEKESMNYVEEWMEKNVDDMVDNLYLAMEQGSKGMDSAHLQQWNQLSVSITKNIMMDKEDMGPHTLVRSIAIANAYDHVRIGHTAFYEAMSVPLHNHVRRGLFVSLRALNNKGQYFHEGKFCYYFHSDKAELVFASMETYKRFMDELHKHFFVSIMTGLCQRVDAMGICLRQDTLHDPFFQSWNALILELRHVLLGLKSTDLKGLCQGYIQMNAMFRQFVAANKKM